MTGSVLEIDISPLDFSLLPDVFHNTGWYGSSPPTMNPFRGYAIDEVYIYHGYCKDDPDLSDFPETTYRDSLFIREQSTNRLLIISNCQPQDLNRHPIQFDVTYVYVLGNAILILSKEKIADQFRAMGDTFARVVIDLDEVQRSIHIPDEGSSLDDIAVGKDYFLIIRSHKKAAFLHIYQTGSLELTRSLKIEEMYKIEGVQMVQNSSYVYVLLKGSTQQIQIINKTDFSVIHPAASREPEFIHADDNFGFICSYRGILVTDHRMGQVLQTLPSPERRIEDMLSIDQYLYVATLQEIHIYHNTGDQTHPNFTLVDKEMGAGYYLAAFNSLYQMR